MKTVSRLLFSLLLLALTMPFLTAEIIRDPVYHVRRGDALAQAKHWDKALAAYRLALELRPGHADAWAGIAQVFEQQNQREAADLALAEALRADSGCPGALLRCEHYLRKDQTARAFLDINHVINNRPDITRAWLVRAKMHLNQNQHDNALQDLTHYLEKNPTDTEAFRLRSRAHRQMGRLKDAIIDLTEVIRLDPKDADAFVQRAKHYEELQEPAALALALADYTKALQLRPDDVSVCLPRAKLLYGQQKYQECVADLNRYLTKYTGHEEALLQRGECHSKLGAHDSALKDFQQVTSGNPKNAKAWDALGDLYQSLDRFTEAVDCFTQVLKLNPADTETLLSRAMAYDSMDKPKEALADASAAINLARHPASAYRMRGLVHYHQGKYAAAEADYTKALELDHRRPDVILVDRSNVFRRQGKLKEALADLDKALEQEPNYISVYTKRASFFVSQGKWADAKATYEKIAALPTRPGMEVTQGYSRVLVLMLSHKYEEGLKLAEEYVSKNPKDHNWLYDIACALAIGAEVVGKDGKHPQAAELKRKLMDRALDLLDQCVALGYRNFVHLRHDWDFESLRSEPRFMKLAQVPAKP